MKKVLFIFFLLLIIYSFNYKKDNSIYVFQELGINKIIYCIDVKNENINTRNINNIFKDVNVISVYPYFNDNYKLLLKNDLDFVQTNMFNDYYKKLLSKIGKFNWVSDYYMGVKLEKVKVYAYEDDVLDLLNKYKLLKICN